MNNTFNYMRFGKIFRKHTIENYRSYLMSAAVLCGIIVVLYSFVLFTNEYKISYPARCSFLMMLYLFAGSIFTSTVFTGFGKKGEAIMSLILPASHFEKFIVAWIYSLLIYTSVFLVCFYAIDILFMNANKLPDQDKRILNIFSDEYNLYMVFYLYPLLHAIVIYGAISFKNLHFVKTACIFFVTVVSLAVINDQLLKSLIPENLEFTPPLITGVSFMFNNDFVRVDLDQSTWGYYMLFLLYSLVIILWMAAFFRLKEKQV